MSTELLKVAERAKRDPQGQILSLARLIDEAALRRAFERIRKGAAVGVDGMSKEQYGKELEKNLENLHERLRTQRYRHQPIRRVHIPKEQGKTRPIGISTIEDKLVQDALREVLETLYEPVFLDNSYGFRPRRSAHDALRALNQTLYRREVSWVIEADIKSYFDSIDRTKLKEMLRMRVADESFMRLVGKCLHVGILDGTEYSEPDEGTVQGSTLSPLLGNVYLHHVLDLWLEAEVRPRLRGRMRLIRYCDDFVIGFEREDEARRVMAVLAKRFERFGLRLHPDKTRLFECGRPRKSQRGGKGPATFDFLGFTVHWRWNHLGFWALGLKTRKARLRRAITSVDDWCRRHRHEPMKTQHAMLSKKLNGHYNYFGVGGNSRSLASLSHQVEQTWRKWLRRRSQRTKLTWQRFEAFLTAFPLLLSLTQFQRGGFVIIRDRWMRISRITSHGSALESGDGKRN
ncbi:MAG: group II intron reverse transcriptase/maturase, partial [Myxococcales bacterium]